MRCPMCLGKGYATDEDIKEYPHRCQNCNGKGFYIVDWQEVRCEVCNGSGKKPKTNEEWRKTCSSEDFAKWLSDIIFDNADAISKCSDKDCRSCKIGWCDKVNVLEWLKQPHTKE